MPIVKKEVYESIKRKLELEQRNLRSKIYFNKVEIKTRVNSQASMKRELAALQQLISSMVIK